MLRVINIQVWRNSWAVRARNADRVIRTRSKHSQQPRGGLDSGLATRSTNDT